LLDCDKNRHSVKKIDSLFLSSGLKSLTFCLASRLHHGWYAARCRKEGKEIMEAIKIDEKMLRELENASDYTAELVKESSDFNENMDLVPLDIIFSAGRKL
jgi:hypothetical protein